MEEDVQQDGREQLDYLKSEAEADVLGHPCQVHKTLHALPNLIPLCLECPLSGGDEASQLQVIPQLVFKHHIISVFLGLVGLPAKFQQGLFTHQDIESCTSLHVPPVDGFMGSSLSCSAMHSL